MATAGWATARLSTVGWAAAGSLGMVQLAAGWGGAAHHTARGQAGVLHAAVRAAPPDSAGHSSRATFLATTNAIAGPTAAGWAAGRLAAAGLATAGLAAAGLAAAGATVFTSRTAGESTEASGTAGHGIWVWVES